VVFTIGAFAHPFGCSTYYDPTSPWYNVFYGAYGIRSHKLDGTAWGFNVDGTPNIAELLTIPELDYNFLTAGELGCPPEKMCFKMGTTTLGKYGGWHSVEAKATIPSGLHNVHDAVKPDLAYYVVFGMPHAKLLEEGGKHQSYEPVAMKGHLFFAEIKPKITLVWGGMTPDTPEGHKLLDQIIGAMKVEYNKSYPHIKPN